MSLSDPTPSDSSSPGAACPQSSGPVWAQVVQDLLRLYAPQGAFMGQLDGRYTLVTAQDITPQARQALEPPDAWLDSGVLDWVSADGHLLGLLWSPGGVGASVVQIFDRLLAPRSQEICTADFQLLLTQLPQPTVWLDMEMNVLEVSHSFLTLFGLERSAVKGKNVCDLGLPLDAAALETALQGRSAEASDGQSAAAMPVLSGQVWLLPSVRSFFTGQQAGMLLTLEDVTQAQQGQEWLQTLLRGLGVPAAVVNLDGEIQQAGRALTELTSSAEQGDSALKGTRLQELPFLNDIGRKTAQNLLTLAAEGGAALAQLERWQGLPLTLELRRSPVRPDLLVAQLGESTPSRSGASKDLVLLQKVLNQQHTATLLLDRHGAVQLINDEAAQLFGVDAARLLGKDLARQLPLLSIELLGGDDRPLSLPKFSAGQGDWSEHFPFSAEVTLVTPAQGRRAMALEIVPVNSAGQARTVAGDLLMLTLRDLTDLRRAQAQATYGAYHDGLTGLYNRAGLRRHLAGLGSEAAAQASTVAVLELDEYAGLNTASGQTAIHHLLMQLAASFRNLTSAYGGEAARLGDGSFALWLPGVPAKKAAALLEQATQGPFRLGQSSTSLTFGIGLAEGGPQPDTALGNAEIAAQYAQRCGRGQTVPYHADLRTQLAETFRLEQALRDTVSSGQLKLHYQPVLNLHTGRLTGAEALLRWERISTQLSPQELLEMAARLGLLQTLSDWVMREALQQQRSWNDLWPDFRMGINLSLEELRQPDALGGLWPLLQGLEAQGSPRPSIEITAASSANLRPQDVEILGQLSATGSELWLDQFGEGIMSLSSLTAFPLTGLKLHPRMVAVLGDSERGADLVAATIDLAGRLGLQVSASGVETEEQKELLTRLGCDYAQGYAISPPLRASALGDWLRLHPAGTPGAPQQDADQ